MISSYMFSHLHFLWPHWSILHFYNVQYFRIKYRSKIFYFLLHWVLHHFAWFFPQSIQTIVFGCFQRSALSKLVTSFIILLNFVGFSFNSSFISLMTSWRSLFFTNYFFFASVLLLLLCYIILLNSTILVSIRRFHRGILLLFSCLLLFFPNNSATTFALTKINNFALLIGIDWFCMNLTHHLIYYLMLFYYYNHYYYFFI